MFSAQSSPETRSLLNHLNTLFNELSETPSKPFLLLALSGGVDSVVLLYLLKILQKVRDFDLHAMHVHHGLSQYADDWARFCQTYCDANGVPFAIKYVAIDPKDALGIEGAARKARYAALSDYEIAGVKPDFILTGHHQNDQAETVLLQWLRGAGPKGLAAMPVVDAKKRLVRPFLQSTKNTLLQVAQAASLDWCEDDSNSNTDFDRNFIRHQVLPLLETRYPSAQASLARGAGHLAATQALLDDLAAMDAGQLIENNSVCLAGLALLSTERAKNLLRWWLGQHQLEMPSSKQLAEILYQLLTAKADAQVSLQIQALCIKRYQSRAYLVANQAITPFELHWQGEQVLPLPNGGRLLFDYATGKGLVLPNHSQALMIVSRRGGERFKPQANRPTQTLKHLLQAQHVPPWQRDHLPLIYSGDKLLYVPFVGNLHSCQPEADEKGLVIRYIPAAL